MSRDELIEKLAKQMFLAASNAADGTSALADPKDAFWTTRAKWALEDVVDDYMRSFFVDKARQRV